MNYNVNLPNATGYSPQQTRGAFNNAMAKAHSEADPRYNMKPLDKAGASRGGSQRMQAGIASAQNLADGIAAAYAVPAADAASNANIGLANAGASEGLGLGVGNIAQQNQYANALAALQRQQSQREFVGSVLGGLTGGGLAGGGLDNFLGY